MHVSQIQRFNICTMNSWISTISHPRHAQTVDVKLTPSVERQPRRPSLVDFPDEILRLIFESLPWQATVQSSMVCQEWYHLCSEERVWKQYCLICFDVSLDSFNICESLSAKELFRNIHLQMTHIITPHAGVQQTHCSLPLAWQPLLFNDWNTLSLQNASLGVLVIFMTMCGGMCQSISKQPASRAMNQPGKEPRLPVYPMICCAVHKINNLQTRWMP